MNEIKYTNCDRKSAPWSILCALCQADYLHGKPVKGVDRIIQNNDGPPVGWRAPKGWKLENEDPNALKPRKAEPWPEEVVNEQDELEAAGQLVLFHYSGKDPLT